MTATTTNDWPGWFAAAGDPGVDGELRAIFHRLQAEIEWRKPTCWISGKCCNFDTYGHRLYVTAMEIAWLLRQIPAQSLPSHVDPHGSCVFQVGKLCGVHSIRPLGCRIFFCQEGTGDWQHEVYERFQAELRVLHETRGIGYRYLEWRSGLIEAIAHKPTVLTAAPVAPSAGR